MERIRFDKVTKSFSMATGRHLLRSHLRRWFRPTIEPPFVALSDVSFTLKDGESLAVVGNNGAGKSTLLNLASRLCYPDQGEVKVNGRVAALLELGSGFHGDLTGQENLLINAALLGFSRKQAAEAVERIVEFSGLGRFIEKPLRMYSSGMVMRLAFSVAIHVEPDILLIDEILAVGDQAFQAKCLERIKKFRDEGRTIVCVAHAPGLLKEMCNQAIWLDRGKVALQGDCIEIISAYEASTLSSDIA